MSPRSGATRKRHAAEVRTEIDQILQKDAFALPGELVGEKMVNVLQGDLELTKRYVAPQA